PLLLLRGLSVCGDLVPRAASRRSCCAHDGRPPLDDTGSTSSYRNGSAQSVPKRPLSASLIHPTEAVETYEQSHLPPGRAIGRRPPPDFWGEAYGRCVIISKGGSKPHGYAKNS